MIRTQVSFDIEQYSALQRRAHERGISMAALVREAVEDKLADRDRERLNQLALSAVGVVSGKPDENISEDHDRYLDEAYGDW